LSPRLRLALERAVAAAGATLVVLGAVFWIFQPSFLGAQADHKLGSGNVHIENDQDRKLFYGLICTCGCPRETLGTCACEFAHERRAELHRFLEEGKTVEQIHAIYVDRYGPGVLAVPKSKATFLIPLALIALGAGAALVIVGRWRKRGELAPGPKKVKKTARDQYDDQLDDELKRMDE
jgi:cytochrome c-type biogenesis protein CcmH